MRILIPFVALFLLSGCVTTEDEIVDPVVDTSASMEFLGAGVKPEAVLFPEYLLMEDFELFQHGRIPETQLIGGGIRSKLQLADVRARFNEILDANGWVVDKLEMGKQSFRLLASLDGDTIEIRAVQGSGPTEIFILYAPLPESEIYEGE